MPRGSDWIKVEPGDTKEFRFDSAEPEVKEGRYGDFYLYEVDDGETLQVSSFLKDLLEAEKGFGDGALVEISCMSKGRKREYEVAVLEEAEEPYEPKKKSSRKSSSKRSSSRRSRDEEDDEDEDRSSRRSSSRSSKSQRTLEDIANEYSACLAAAVPICEAELRDWTSEDQRSIATTLYIQAQREGVEFPKD